MFKFNLRALTETTESADEHNARLRRFHSSVPVKVSKFPQYIRAKRAKGEDVTNAMIMHYHDPKVIGEIQYRCRIRHKKVKTKL